MLRAFHPTLARWFEHRFGEPTAPQREGWPAIRAGHHALIAAPTGTGKTLAAFLTALDALFRQGESLPEETQVLYVSPLKALGNDIRKNLDGPLAELRTLDPSLPDVRVLVRSGDTPAARRAAMAKRPPHVLVTTPESLYILLTSRSGRAMLGTVRTVIVDEIHAVLGSKRGSHLALSLERLEALAGPVQRIGLSATQKPISDVARFLCGVARPCVEVDAGHRRELDLAMEVPPSELSAVCSHEVWDEIHRRMVDLIEAHRTTIVFTNTRKLTERIAARLSDLLGEDAVTSHHGSLSKERRLDAERRLKEGSLRALVATASLELGIDIGDVDLVIQVGATSSIATFLQRVGRAGHALGKVPKGRIFPLTQDELVAATALMRAVQRGDLDRTPQPGAPLDILAQQVVAACVPETWSEDGLFETMRLAWPYRALAREDFDRVLDMHADGRLSLLHRDGVGGRVRATRRASMVAMTSGGAIPDRGAYRVLLEPEGTLVGTLDEDFAIESSAGDVFQLGNASWRVLRVEPGTVRVADARGVPPSLPFWFGEAPARTPELSREICAVREAALRGIDVPGVPEGAADQLEAFVGAGAEALGGVPTQSRLVIERFFDESGGMQLVLHAPFGSRINRAFGLALRKRFCRGFGFELQAAATEDAIVLSLGPQHAFELEGVFRYLDPDTARHVLEQALLPTPFFKTRWRWNVTRSLMLPRMRGGKRLPIALARMRADDLLVASFPEVLACPETLAGPDIEIPWDHPLVRQTMEDCLHEVMDVDGFLDLLRRIHAGEIECVAIDTPEPSAFARGVLNAKPYAFLDDAPLEERRTHAVMARHLLDPKTADELGALDPEAVDRVCSEAWPDPRDAEEVHEALLWMGYVASAEAPGWAGWLEALRGARRVTCEDGRWYAVEASRDPVEVLRGRMEALGPVALDDPARFELERRGELLRVRLDGRDMWCNRRLLARIHRYTVERLREAIKPVHAADFLRFLACWQHVDSGYQLEGPQGVETVLRQLAGYEVPARAFEREVLPARISGYRLEHLDQVALSGEFVWGRLWGGSAAALKQTPITFVPREDLQTWQALAGAADASALTGAAREAYEALREHGPMFPQELRRRARLLSTQIEAALAELVARGIATCDSFGPVRQLLAAPHRRKHPVAPQGRWCLLRPAPAPEPDAEALGGFVARRLLERTGIVFRRTATRERIPLPWRSLLRVYRRMELRGEVRGGRFVAGFDGEQYALPEAVPFVRKIRGRADKPALEVVAADPLNFRGILTPDARVSPTSGERVQVVAGPTPAG
jgi:ATP-dependent Lhr-like helicase